MVLAFPDYSIYRDVIAQLMTDNEQLPSLPSITLEIRQALSKPDVSLAQLAKTLAKDPSLSAMLLKYASGPMCHHPQALGSLLDVVRLLGLAQIERITMLHSVKSLFTLHSVTHKKLFVAAWNRMVLKASVSAFIAQQLPKIAVDKVLLAALLSEIGTLAVLSAFKDRERTPPQQLYVSLCREYSKSLGVIMLKKWQVNDEFIQVIRRTGDWFSGANEPLGIADVVNMGLYHALLFRRAGSDLPAITSLAAYCKLSAPFNQLNHRGGLALIAGRAAEIRALAIEMFKVAPL